MLLFFDLVFEANFNDFRLQFGGPKTMKFGENRGFLATLVVVLLWQCFWLRFWSIFEAPRGQIGRILVPEASGI